TACQQGTCRIAGKLPGDTAPAVKRAARVLRFKIRLVVDITKAQRPGVEAIFICRRRRSNDRTVELSVIANGDVEATSTGKQPGLFGHGVEATLHLILADADVARAGHGAKREAASSRH